MTKRDADPELTRRQSENARAAISASKIVSRLQDNAEGKITMTPTQVRAAGILLDKVLPSLSAIDQTVREEPPTSEQEILNQIDQLLETNPELRGLFTGKTH